MNWLTLIENHVDATDKRLKALFTQVMGVFNRLRNVTIVG
jgi:hypothetical protein